ANLRSQLNMSPQPKPSPAPSISPNPIAVPEAPPGMSPFFLSDMMRQGSAAAPAPSGRAAQRPDWANNTPGVAEIYAGLDWVADNISKPLVDNFGGLMVPGVGAASVGARGAASAGA